MLFSGAISELLVSLEVAPDKKRGRKKKFLLRTQISAIGGAAKGTKFVVGAGH